MASYKVKSSHEIFMGIVFHKVFHFAGSKISIPFFCEEIKDHISQGIVHHPVKLFPVEIFSLHTVAYLIACVFPNLSYKKLVLPTILYRLADLLYKLIRKFISHIKSEASCSRL